jgi:glycosyltransferase involved in cell wall biosynthesis
MSREGYIPKDKRKKILLIGDDVRFNSGCSTMLREIVIGTSHKYNWVQIAGAIKHPNEGQRLDLSAETNQLNDIPDASVYLYAVNGYGNPDLIRQMLKQEKPDALFIMTDPRFFIWLFQMENEIRKQIPLIYYNIWDNLPYPYYNQPYYESCDALLAISKQTENINKIILGDKAKNKVIKYIPHGINEKTFFPITSEQPEYLTLQEFKKQQFRGREYDFVLFFNARNIRRKSIPDLLEAYKHFCDDLTDEQAAKCVFLLHTQLRDENGTNLEAVCKLLFEDSSKYNIIFNEAMLTPQQMNLLYNSVDCTALISDNEGWGLSLTESMMCGKPIIANITGGMQDQMRFDDGEKWIQFSKEFGSNHRGPFTNHGKWAFPVFSSNISMVGSIPTPYIYSDRVSAEDVAKAIREIYSLKIHNRKYYDEICEAAREWVISDESMMSATNMCKNMIEGIDVTLKQFKPRENFELIKS